MTQPSLFDTPEPRTAKARSRAKLCERIMGDLSDAVVDSLNAPKCDDCGTEMSRYYEAADTGANGWRCDDCGWTWDDAPEPAPYQRHSSTSRAAAESIAPKAGTYLARVLAYLTASTGATDERQQIDLNMNPSTQRPRRISLVERGLVRDSGRKGLTKAGKLAVIWELVR